MSSLSAAEKKYIERGISLGCRNDGRGLLGMRCVRVILGELPHSHGSARCVVGASETEVLVSVKAELVSLLEAGSGNNSSSSSSSSSSNSKAGGVCGVECSARLLSSASGGGQGTPESSELASMLQALLGAPGVIPLDTLTLVPGRWQWKLYLDALVIASDGGGVVDAAALAACAALRATRLPAITVLKGLGGGTTPTAAHTLDLQLNDDIGAAWALPGALTNIPLTLTLHYIKGHALVDATGEELACSSANITVGMNAAGGVTFLRCYGREGSSPQDLGVAMAAAQKLIPILFGALPKEEEAEEKEEEEEKGNEQ
jgi:exosome complex component RRP42